MALNETFTTPDGTLSFRYPTGWTVTQTMDQKFGEATAYKSWEVTDLEGQITLQLGVSTGIAPIGSAPLTTILPQGIVPGVEDALGPTTRVVVAASPGQALGANGGLHFGLAADVGGDTTLFSPRWGENHLLSFGGWRELGPNDQVDFDAEAQEFAASPEFRNQILPIIQSLTASAPPEFIGVAPEEPMEGSCVGARFTYLNLAGITCDEAKSIMQTTLDTGLPKGARGHVANGIECYESSYGERLEGSPDMMCWVLDAYGSRHDKILEANYR